MNQAQWDMIKRCANGEDPGQPPVALIVDSPWIPGYVGMSTLDYLTLPDQWRQANLQVLRDFPRAIFLPGCWVEMGMTAEPSGFGCRVSFYREKTPVAHPVIASVEELGRLSPPDPRTDGLMPMVLNYYRYQEPRLREAGQAIKMVAARGPLTVATHLMGVTNFLLDLKLHPAETHRLLKLTTTLTRQWLEAQIEALREVEGIMVLDDIAGFLSPKDYLEFAHPYLLEVFRAFGGMVKLFHNDTDNHAAYKHLGELPIHIFNFTHLQPIAKVRALVGPKLCLMGNVPPLEILAQGSPEQARESARQCVQAHGGSRGLILSAGGGVSPGTPGGNIRALLEAL